MSKSKGKAVKLSLTEFAKQGANSHDVLPSAPSRNEDGTPANEPYRPRGKQKQISNMSTIKEKY
jgi:hypothetical protein